jgi:hypothetical protein
MGIEFKNFVFDICRHRADGNYFSFALFAQVSSVFLGILRLFFANLNCGNFESCAATRQNFFSLYYKSSLQTLWACVQLENRSRSSYPNGLGHPDHHGCGALDVSSEERAAGVDD